MSFVKNIYSNTDIIPSGSQIKNYHFGFLYTFYEKLFLGIIMLLGKK